MTAKAKTLKRLAQAPAIKAARDKLALVSPNERRAALRQSAAKFKKMKQNQ